MVLLEAAATQGDALRREAAIKRLGRAAKEALITLAAAKEQARTRRAKAARRPRAAAGS